PSTSSGWWGAAPGTASSTGPPSASTWPPASRTGLPSTRSSASPPSSGRKRGRSIEPERARLARGGPPERPSAHQHVSDLVVGAHEEVGGQEARAVGQGRAAGRNLERALPSVPQGGQRARSADGAQVRHQIGIADLAEIDQA